MKQIADFFRKSFLVLWSAICLFPIYWLVIASFKSPNDQFDGPFFVPFIDFQPTLEAWRFILTDQNENLLWAFFNSFVAASCATVIAVTFGALAVFGVTRFPRKSRRFIFQGDNLLFGLLVTRILPPTILVVPLYFMAQISGTLDTVYFLIFAYAALNVPVAIWLLRPVLGDKATEMEESALVEGASHLRIFFEFVVPVSAAGFAAVGMIVFILCWNEYLVAAFLATNNAITLPTWAVGQLSMKEAQIGGEAEEWAHMAAATVFMMLPVLAIALFGHRFLSKLNFFRR
jgi:multiple sugar transport system permease protein